MFIEKIKSGIVKVSCDFRLTTECRNIWNCRKESYTRSYKANDGKNICCKCQIFRKNSRQNNSKYLIDKNFFKQIDNEEKAYILGLIASDGHISNDSIYIQLHAKDTDILEKIVNILCPLKEIKTLKNNMKRICFSSKQWVRDITRHLNINPGKKSKIVDLSTNLSIDLFYCFLRGIVDGDGSIGTKYKDKLYPVLNIATTSSSLKETIQKYINIPSNIYPNSIVWNGRKCLPILDNIYKNASIYLDRKYNNYLRCLQYYEN